MTFELNSDQARAAETLTRHVVVTAGAGSGKTRMLTQRFINGVIPGRVDGWVPASVDEIVAITFTDKAAGELAERVRLTLRDAGFVDEARRVDGAWVSTIHGLCSRLLRRHAFEAGIDPLFSVADTVVTGRLRADAFERAAVALVRENSDVAALFDAYSYDRVFEAVRVVSRELAVRGLAATDVELESADTAEALLGRAVDLFSDGRVACDDYSGTAKAAGNFTDQCAILLGKTLALQESALDERQAIAGLARIAAAYKPVGVAKGLESAREDSKARGDALRGEVGAALLAPCVRGLQALVTLFSEEFASLKRSVGVLDFDDLQTGAVELLTREPELSKRYRDRFRLVMIDEFQDTDALQLRLVEALSQENLCTVGDEKQSIYRFRGADIEVYRQHRKQMSEGDALEVSLAVNYRSHPSVLAFVNAVFSSEQYFAGDLLRLIPPAEGRPSQEYDSALGNGLRVEALLVDSSAVSTATGRQAEARQIALRLAALRRSGISPGDMVVLVRAYTNAHIYAEALTEVGVPATVVGGSRFFGLEETTIMRALTRAIANPSDGSAVGELLASEFCPISDDGLAKLRLGPDGRDKRPLWALLRDNRAVLGAEDPEAVRRLVALVESARQDTGTRPLSDILLQAVEDAGYDVRLLSQGNSGREAFANVLKFAREAAGFEADGGAGPAGLAAHLDARERLGDVEAPASVADNGSSAVRIMSVHASKGLEFPVVVVPDLASGGRGGADIVRTAACAGRLKVALVPPTSDDGTKPPGSLWAEEFSEIEKQASAEEGDRVLYVAFTRARDLLIASGSMNMRPKGESKASHHLIRLARLLGVQMPVTGTIDMPATLTDSATGEGAAVRVQVLSAEQVMAEPAEVLESSRQEECLIPPTAGDRISESSAGVEPPREVSYSSLHRFERCPRQFLLHDILRIRHVEVLEEGAVDPSLFGSAMHAALQLVSPEGLPPDEQRITAIGRQFELDSSQLQRLARSIERFVTSATAASAVAHQRVAREMPFALPLASGACILSGSIDLYAHSESEALVVDYKSGTSATVDDLEARYRLQAECYALAALVDGRETVEVVFVRPEVIGPDGGIQEIRYRFGREDEPSLREAIESLYDRIVTSSYEPLPARDETVCGYCAAPTGLCPNARP